MLKYIYKGHDRADIEIINSHDEIKQFLDTRYVTAPEAGWRLNEFKMHEKSHTVFRLHVHLPSAHRIYFIEGEEMQALENVRETTLLA